MSEEDVEIVRRHIEAYQRGDVSRSMSFLDPNVVLDTSRVPSLDFGPAYGHEDVVQSVRHYIGAFEDYAYQVDRLTDLASGAVVAVVNETGRGKGSHVPVERSYATLYTVIADKIARITQFPTEQAAIKAAGLSE
jgi:ketosteroid isomerase-like protein